MSSDNNRQSTLTRVFIGAVFVLSLVFLFLFAAGRFDDNTSVSDSPESGYSQDSTMQSESTVQGSESAPQIEGTVQSSESNTTESAPQSSEPPVESSAPETLRFRNQKLLDQHYEKHGIEMGFSSAEEYEKAAAAVVDNPEALHKTEAEDGDDVYYIESTNEFVIVSTDGYLRTYFNPDRGIDYFNRQ